MTKTLQNLNESDLEAIAELVWANNTWFERDGQQVSLETLKNELVGYARDRAELQDKHNAPCMVGE